MSASESIIVVGGGPAGHATAAAYREAGGTGRLVLLCGEPELPYNRPPLTKDFLRGASGRADLPLADRAFYAARDIDVRLGSVAEEIDLAAGEVRLEGGTRIGFDQLVLATGSEPQRPPFPGGEDPDLHTMRTVADAARLASKVREGTRAVVIGAGFIGCEAAASLAMAGARVCLVAPEPAPQAARLGDVAAARLTGWLEGYGVELRLEAQVEALERLADGGFGVRLERGEALGADVVLLGTGVRPRTELAEAAGLLLADGGGIQADAALRTSHPAVRVAGDIAAAEHAAAGRRLRVEHWGDALAQGKVVGQGLAGRPAQWSEPPGFWSTVGEQTLKHSAWGDGFDSAEVRADTPERLVIAYRSEGELVGLLAHGDDEAYETARDTLRARAA